MTYISDHERRYGPLFERESWWEMHRALYEGPGHDWEGASIAMEQMLYDLAKARGLDTAQVCPSCKQVVDEARSLGFAHCVACEAEEERRHQDRVADRERERLAHETWYASLTPEQREAYDRENQEVMRIAMRGLIARDVQ